MLEINNTTKQKINILKTTKIVEKFLTVYQKSNWTVSLAIVGPQRIRTLNRKYRQQDQVTDVLSFSGTDLLISPSKSSTNKFLGEIIINISDTQKISKYQTTLKEIGLEKTKSAQQATYIFYFLIVHALLHLVGYNDDQVVARREMLDLGRDFLKKML